jgi:hypothetical protein
MLDTANKYQLIKLIDIYLYYINLNLQIYNSKLYPRGHDVNFI